jgi:hypothetical protein
MQKCGIATIGKSDSATCVKVLMRKCKDMINDIGRP